MKIHLCSDLHLEFGPVTLPGGEVLVLAGDVCEVRSLKKDFHSTRPLPYEPGNHRYYDFFYHECAKYEQVFYVVGNHEYYHGRFDLAIDELKAIMPPNVTVLERETAVYRGVVFCGATLWTNCNNGDSLTMYHLKFNMNDYRHIKNHFKYADLYHKMTPEATFADHVKTMNYFGSTLSEYRDTPTMVITHHAPSFNSISEQYRGDFHMNGGYASDLSEFILDNPQIKFWAHGHVHSAHDYEIGNCRIVCQPRGYYGHESIASNFTVKEIELDA